MKREAEWWIDNREAVIVFLASKEQEIKLVNSNVEKHKRHPAV
jgi:hypothetical protein